MNYNFKPHAPQSAIQRKPLLIIVSTLSHTVSQHFWDQKSYVDFIMNSNSTKTKLLIDNPNCFVHNYMLIVSVFISTKGNYEATPQESCPKGVTDNPIKAMVHQKSTFSS